jgi:hypothetical protein
MKVKLEDQRRHLTQSIISTLPRRELESLLLEAALGDEAVMGSIVRVNGLKRDVPSSEAEESVQAGEERGFLIDAEQEGGTALARSDDGPGERSKEEVLNFEGGRERGEDMESIPSMGGDGPLQFHHLTKRQFEARMAMMREVGRLDSALV